SSCVVAWYWDGNTPARLRFSPHVYPVIAAGAYLLGARRRPWITGVLLASCRACATVFPCPAPVPTMRSSPGCRSSARRLPPRSTLAPDGMAGVRQVRRDEARAECSLAQANYAMVVVCEPLYFVSSSPVRNGHDPLPLTQYSTA